MAASGARPKALAVGPALQRQARWGARGVGAAARDSGMLGGDAAGGGGRGAEGRSEQEDEGAEGWLEDGDEMVV